MKDRLKYSLIGLTLAVLAGALINYFSGWGFWQSTLIAALALIANGVFADWEDRGTFND